MENFYFVSDYGKRALPSKTEITQILENNDEKILLVLDSSICMDIVNLVKHKKSAHCDKNKIYNLIDFVQKNKVEHFTLFALLELCYDRNTLELQSEKYFDFKNMIDYAFQYPLKKFKKYEYNFLTDCIFFGNPEFKSDAIKILISERINLYYAALLKICEIGQKGLSASRAEKSIQEFIDWMEIDLNVILGLEYSLALEIFGGNTKLISMIKLGATKEKILKSIWGTAWDLFHGRMSCNKEQISILLDKKVYPIFATKDSYLFDLISTEVNHYKRVNESKLSINLLTEYPKNYSEEFFEKLNKRMMGLIDSRVETPAKFNFDELFEIIENLEKNIK